MAKKPKSHDVVIRGETTNPRAYPETVRVKKSHHIRWKNTLEKPVSVDLQSEPMELNRVEIAKGSSEKLKVKDKAKKGLYPYSIEVVTKGDERLVVDPYIDVEEDE